MTAGESILGLALLLLGLLFHHLNLDHEATLTFGVAIGWYLLALWRD